MFLSTNIPDVATRDERGGGDGMEDQGEANRAAPLAIGPMLFEMRQNPPDHIVEFGRGRSHSPSVAVNPNRRILPPTGGGFGISRCVLFPFLLR